MTLGNVTGGGVFVAAVYWVIYLRTADEAALAARELKAAQRQLAVRTQHKHEALSDLAARGAFPGSVLDKVLPACVLAGDLESRATKCRL